jgi:hypothetical protein
LMAERMNLPTEGGWPEWGLAFLEALRERGVDLHDFDRSTFMGLVLQAQDYRDLERVIGKLVPRGDGGVV